MIKKNSDQPIFDLVPMELEDMGSVMDQLKNALLTALAIPPEDFPADKQMSVILRGKAIVVPEIEVVITKK